MEAIPVIARAYLGEPLRRVALDMSDRLVYITTPERIPAVEMGNWCPTGFPKEDIFYYNSNTYEILLAQWRERGETDPAVWRTLSRYAVTD